MAILRATVTLDSKSGADIDEAKNVWHFETAAAVTADNMATAGAGLVAFYRALGARFGSSVSRAADAHRIDFAQVTQGAAGEEDDVTSKVLAKRVFDFVGMGGGAASLPSEVAVALSFRGDVVGIPEEAPGGLTRPASRRRGRVFLGPLVHAVILQDATTGRNAVSAAFRQEVLDAYADQALPLWVAGTGPVRHIVYSRASAGTHPVQRIHVDDAFDTVRRRGERAVERSFEDVVQAVI